MRAGSALNTAASAENNTGDVSINRNNVEGATPLEAGVLETNNDNNASGGTLDGGLQASDSQATDGLPNAPNSPGGQTHICAPEMMEDFNPKVQKNHALNAVLTALSNYNDDEYEIDDYDEHSAASVGRLRPTDGWGVDSNIEGTNAWDRPVVLHGANGVLAKHQHHSQPGEEEHFDSSPYHVMEDLDAVDRMCVQNGSMGYPAHNWKGAMHDGRQELMFHFREYWRDILDDDESGRLEKFLLICEFPMTIARKLTVSIPCEGSYCRALVATSFALSPLWLGAYALSSFDVNLWGWEMAVFVGISFSVGLLVMRYAPGGDGTMTTMLAVS